MKLSLLLPLIVVGYGSQTNAEELSVRHRPKRWINFPKGSSLQLVYCWLISTYGTDDGIFTVGITVGLAWEIPVDLRNAVFERGRSLHDEHRRELHWKVKRFIDQQGQSGNSCVQKAMCDANSIPENRKLKFMHALLYEVFKLDSNDEEDSKKCGQQHSCSFSLFDDIRPIAM